MLEFKNFRKSYDGKKDTVKDLNFTVEDGDICAFIGHNGAGKTTTLKCVAGILEITGGDILIDGKSIKKFPLQCKKILSYLPDNPDIYDHLTGIDYLNFICDIFKIKDERNELIKKYADMFEITESLGDSISTYSHGMKQKLAIISALIHKPKLMVLDEPFVGLDPKAAYVLKQIMHEFCAEGGAVFFSTHVLDVAEKLCNKIAILRKGELIADCEHVCPEMLSFVYSFYEPSQIILISDSMATTGLKDGEYKFYNTEIVKKATRCQLKAGGFFGGALTLPESLKIMAEKTPMSWGLIGTSAWRNPLNHYNLKSHETEVYFDSHMNWICSLLDKNTWFVKE